MSLGPSREYNFDGLVGPTHNYSGLSQGNLKSEHHRGFVSDPRAAALQGLAKMERLLELGIGQAVLPPQPRPDVEMLRKCGFSGSTAEVLRQASREAESLLFAACSASAMWTANAATVAPSSDTLDGVLHLVPANLIAMFHRSLEPETTTSLLQAIFADEQHFKVHQALSAHPGLGDEGAANHTRLATDQGTVHLFGWGHSPAGSQSPTVHPARQTREASAAVARLNQISNQRCLLWQQHPDGIDRGAFHSDVLAVGNERFFMLHELAFVDHAALLQELRRRLGDGLCITLATEKELPIDDAVAAYPFNSQVVTKPDGGMLIVAPTEARDNPAARRFLDRVVEEENPVRGIEYLDVRQSMANGGGPACLRLRIPLTQDERHATGARVFVDTSLLSELRTWIGKHYRDRLALDDLQDPSLPAESHHALDELTQILKLGSVYAFQR